MDFRNRLEPKSAASPSLGKSVHQFGKEMLPRICAGLVLRARRGWSGDLLIADREDFENLAPSDIHVKRFKLEKIAQEGYPSFPCADGHSTSSIFLNPNAAKCLRGEP